MILRRDFLAGLMGTAAATSLPHGLLASPQNDAAPVSEPAKNLANDPLRPQYHLLPAANWMNDPNGPIYWNDRYHMFYQYNPNGAFWGDMHWGHAVSTDMVHWKHLPVALAPNPGGPDAEGCFTGTCVVQEGKVVVIYTGVQASAMKQATIRDANPPLRETQCLAIANDPDLTSWTRLPAPVIAELPAGIEVNGFRDPSPWKQGDWWYTVLGSGIANQGGAVLLFRSKDLRSWEFVHLLASKNDGAPSFDPFDPWDVWECPEIFSLGGKHVLICSTGGKAYWRSGTLDPATMRFHSEQAGILDYGSFYAPKTQLDKAGNRIIWGWISEARPVNEHKAAGWAGMMSLPRVLTLGSDGRLRTSVAEEVNALRKSRQVLDITHDEEKNQRQIDAMRLKGCAGEIQCEVQRTSAPFTLVLAGSAADAAPWLTLEYDPGHRGQIAIDGRRIPVALGDQESFELHFYVDGSVIETFVNRQACLTERFYYTGSAQDLRLRWTGKTSNIVSLTVWQLSPISADRLTT